VVTVFWDERGVIIVNSDHCTEKLRSLNDRFRRILRTKIMSEMLFLHGNARPHTSFLTIETDQFWMNSSVASALLSRRHIIILSPVCCLGGGDAC
jgi:hypothetical protein